VSVSSYRVVDATAVITEMELVLLGLHSDTLFVARTTRTMSAVVQHGSGSGWQWT
jgi:hypothetical protein